MHDHLAVDMEDARHDVGLVGMEPELLARRGVEREHARGVGAGPVYRSYEHAPVGHARRAVVDDARQGRGPATGRRSVHRLPGLAVAVAVLGKEAAILVHVDHLQRRELLVGRRDAHHLDLPVFGAAQVVLVQMPVDDGFEVARGHHVERLLRKGDDLRVGIELPHVVDLGVVAAVRQQHDGLSLALRDSEVVAQPGDDLIRRVRGLAVTPHHGRRNKVNPARVKRIPAGPVELLERGLAVFGRDDVVVALHVEDGPAHRLEVHDLDVGGHAPRGADIARMHEECAVTFVGVLLRLPDPYALAF